MMLSDRLRPRVGCAHEQVAGVFSEKSRPNYETFPILRCCRRSERGKCRYEHRGRSLLSFDVVPATSKARTDGHDGLLAGLWSNRIDGERCAVACEVSLLGDRKPPPSRCRPVRPGHRGSFQSNRSVGSTFVSAVGVRVPCCAEHKQLSPFVPWYADELSLRPKGVTACPSNMAADLNRRPSIAGQYSVSGGRAWLIHCCTLGLRHWRLA